MYIYIGYHKTSSFIKNQSGYLVVIPRNDIYPGKYKTDLQSETV